MELLVAASVASIILIILVSVLSKSMDVSKRANATMLSKSSAQAGLDVMVTDFDSLLVNRNAGEVFRFTNLPITNATTLTNSTIYLLTTSMMDSYSTNGSANPGVPRLVQYVIQYSTNYANVNSSSFSLCRNVIDPTNTFNNVIASTSPLDSNWFTFSANTNTTTNVLVPNVVGINVSLYTNYGGTNSIWTNSSGVTNSAISSTNFPKGVVLEISLTVLDEPALSLFGNGSGSGNRSSTYLINQSGRTLIRRIALPSPP